VFYKVNTDPSRFKELIDRLSNTAPLIGYINVICNRSITESLHFQSLVQDIVRRFTLSFKVFLCNYLLVNFILTAYLKMPLLYKVVIINYVYLFIVSLYSYVVFSLRSEVNVTFLSVSLSLCLSLSVCLSVCLSLSLCV
jgi:hypothetical protein